LGRDCGSWLSRYSHAIAACVGAKCLGVLAVSLDIGRCSPVAQVVPDQPASLLLLLLLPVLSSPHLTTPHHLPSINKTSHTHSLAQHYSTSTDASNEITHLFHATSKQLLCANAGLQDKYTYETPRESPPALRPAASLSSGFSHGVSTRPANGLIIAPFPDFLFLLDPMSCDYRFESSII
jgi:hypothetical protein